ncbi:membrane integrity-associated transporter subunit PqiC [Rahnella inusitata]|uniref:PqiC family protein n=1 Tax=Rahnella inusitata TaxID=58169 RepID=UPI0039BDFEA6
MKLTAALNIACALLMLSGCASSTPPHYYTLVDGDRVPPAVVAAPFAIRMHPVTLPEQLNQPELVMRKGDGELFVSDNALWASPLPEEMRSALTGQLERSLYTVEVSGLTPPQDKPVVGISVAVQQFDAWPGNRASIAVTWRLSFDAGSAEEQLLTCRTQHQKTSQGGYSGLVATQQALIRDVATDIANSIKTRQCG